MDDLKKIASEKERWKKEKKIENLPPAFSDLGRPLSLVYTPDDLEGRDYQQDLGFPGEFPFTRGVYPGMYRKGPWQKNRVYPSLRSAARWLMTCSASTFPGEHGSFHLVLP